MLATSFPGQPFDPVPLWSNPDTPGPQYRMFRASFEVRGDRSVELRLFAEGRYHAWLDGRYLGRGPGYHHPFECLFDPYELSHSTPGRHVLAVLVYRPNLATFFNVPNGTPGLYAQLSGLDDDPLKDNVKWRVTDRTGFRSDVPRRTLAIDHVECFDAEEHPAGWTLPGFDDSRWSVPSRSARPKTLRITRCNPTPRLAYKNVEAKTPVASFAINDDLLDMQPELQAQPDTLDAAGLAGTEAYGRALMDLSWEPITSGSGGVTVAGDAERGFLVSGLSPTRGVALVLDLGAEYVGEPTLRAHSESSGVIDLGFAESLDEQGRPQLMMKHGSYANRVLTSGGAVAYEALRWSGFRYLAVILRGFTGEVRLESVGARVSAPVADWLPDVWSDDATLDAIYALSTRTLRLGCQESLIDCPTREQATYLGDGHPMARWFWQRTGDASYWKRLVLQQFARPASNGLIRTVAFSSGPQVLLDYALLAIVGTHDYVRATGDLATAAEMLPAARGVLGWFERQMDADGLCWVDDDTLPRQPGRESLFDPSAPRCDQMLRLFIDHAGVGWHNLGEPGINRQGLNAALQALLCIAESSLEALENAAGSSSFAEVLTARCSRRRVAARRRFFDVHRGVFADGELDGQRHEQVSQQTNVWAVLAGWCDGMDEARETLRQVFDTPDSRTARCGPYFWTYAVEALKQAGLTELMLDQVAALWSPMLEAGTTSLWETFAGDELDSRCHPWSAAPIDAISRGVFGIDHDALRTTTAGVVRLILTPEPWRFASAHLKQHTSAGPISLRWQRNQGLHGVLEVATAANVELGLDKRHWDEVTRDASSSDCGNAGAVPQSHFSRNTADGKIIRRYQSRLLKEQMDQAAQKQQIVTTHEFRC